MLERGLQAASWSSGRASLRPLMSVDARVRRPQRVTAEARSQHHRFGSVRSSNSLRWLGAQR